MNRISRNTARVNVALLALFLFSLAGMSAFTDAETGSDTYGDYLDGDAGLISNISAGIGEFDLIYSLPSGTTLLLNGNYLLPDGMLLLPNGSCVAPDGSYIGEAVVDGEGNITFPEGVDYSNITRQTRDVVDDIIENPGQISDLPTNISVGRGQSSEPVKEIGVKIASVPTITMRYIPAGSDIRDSASTANMRSVYTGMERLPVLGGVLDTGRSAAGGTSAAILKSVMGGLPFLGRESTPAPSIGMDGKSAAGVGVVSFTAVLLSMLFAGSGKQSAAMLAFPVAYTRLRKDKILQHDIRGNIYREVVNNPGVNLLSIKKKLELENGVLAYHVATLERENFIKSHRDGRLRRLYVCGYKVSKLSAMRQDVLNIIEESTSAGISQKELADRLDVSKQTVNYHIRKLEEMGIVAVEKKGRESRCILLRRGS